ncbi:unnamed protein product [Periconia digitata]|uniref:Uncharacterized protein n=1 Tax=Periconia digitata TaxID=1303443 RepID=A0A9W4UNB6_9PLEO|nr:unnamed protein product [Periconia digitata]
MSVKVYANWEPVSFTRSCTASRTESVAEAVPAPSSSILTSGLYSSNLSM